MKRSTVIWIAIGLAILLFLVAPLTVNLLFNPTVSLTFFNVEWEADDALAYTGGALACFGTIILSIIAWKQNQELQKVEKNSFIAANSCMALLSSFQFSGFNSLEVNPLNHSEPFMVSDDIVKEGIVDGRYTSLTLFVTLNRLDNYASIVRVKSLIFSVDGEINSVLASFSPYDDCFSRIAMFEDSDKFEITILLSPEIRESIISILKGDCKVIAEIEMDLVTPNYVSTSIKSRGTFDLHDALTENARCDGHNLMCFWYGNQIIPEQDLILRR